MKFSVSPISLVRSFWMNYRLILDLAKRDAIGKYKGSSLGIFWSLITPIFMLSIYTFVFSEIFKARWSVTSTSKSEFAIVLFAGMLVFNLFSEIVNRAPTLIINNVNFVKKIVFPLEILAYVNLISAIFHLIISVLVLLIFQFIATETLPWTVILLPAVIFPLALISLGLSWFLSAIGVFLRDVGQTIGILVTGLMFLSPVFFPLSAIPLHWQEIAQWNPLVLPIEMARQVLIWGQVPDLNVLATYTCVACLIAWSGFVCFQKTRRGFADVL